MVLGKKNVIWGVAAVGAAIFYFTAIGIYASAIEVSGIFLDAKGGVALVNGAMVTAGDTVEGAQVVKITSEGVVLLRDGQEFVQHLKDPNPSVPDQKASPAAKKSSTASHPSSSSKKNSPMKTLYGIPIKNFFPDQETVKQEIQEGMPVNGSVLDPATVQQLLHRASDLQDKADAKRRETEQRVKEMESQ